jgi:NADH:ubiquinone oxidoreductase subunit 6 (subunit J)
MIERYLLYATLAGMILSAVGVVTVRNIFRSALLLGMTLFSIAGIYLLLGAEFIAAVQILVYIGGILTLIIFAIMFTKNLSDKTIRQSNEQKGTAFFISSLILAIMVYGIWKTPMQVQVKVPRVIDTASIGRVLFQHYVLAFEIVSVLLLVALVGAIILARREAKND